MERTYPKGETKRWKIQLVGIFVMIFLFASTMIFAVSVFAITDERYAESIGDTVIVSGLFTLGLSVILARLIYLDHTRYEIPSYCPTNYEGDPMYKKRAKQCILCKRHPLSEKYHVKKVHGLEHVDVKSYFKSCGCNICVKYQMRGFG